MGSLFVNPGGPGFGGSDLVTYADQLLADELTDSFDIVGFDPRGTGLSEPAIDCIDDYDHFYSGTDITPDDDAERQQIVDLALEFAEACAANNADIIQFVGTNNAARDIDALRRSLGEEEISYLGWSYGAELGGTWATLFPSTVRAAVFDSAPDPHAEQLEAGLRQSEGFEQALSTYLAECSADPSCAFHNDGDAEGAFDELMLELDANPIPSIEGRPEITRGVALTAVAQAMYGDSLWPDLSRALDSAQRGNGTALLRLYDEYFGYNVDGTWGNELEAFQTIACMDSVERPSVDEDDATAPMFTEIAPRMAPHTTGAYFCTFFPAAAEPRIEITGAGAGPIVLCGTTDRRLNAAGGHARDGREPRGRPPHRGRRRQFRVLGSIGMRRTADHRLSRRPRRSGHGDRLRSQLAGAANAQVSSRRHGPAGRDGVAAGGAVDSLTSIVGWKTAPGMRRSVRAINCKARLPAAWPTSAPG